MHGTIDIPAEGGSHMATQHDKQFKLDAIQYYEDHKDLGLRGCAENLGIGYSTLTKWRKEFRESGGSIGSIPWIV